MDKIEIIKNVNFLELFEEEVLVKIAHRFQTKKLKEGECLFREGDLGDSFYIITKGEIEIIKELHKEYSIETDLLVLTPYSYFGEMALVDDSPRSATVKAKTDVELLTIDKVNFLDICRQYPDIILHLIRTISARLRVTNEKFIETWDSLLKKNKMAAIGNAVSKIVHDIKTPITVTVLTAQLIGKLYPDVGKYSEKIIKQIHLLDDMVKEILEFAKGDKIKLKIQKIEVEPFITELIDNIKEIADQNKTVINLENNFQGYASFDRQKIYRTVTNIVKNAFEAMKKEGKITVSTDKCGNYLQIRIRDYGPGIPEDILDTIFEPFVTKGKSGGTGLGLAICKKVVEDHNGLINVSNHREGGAQFELLLPL